MKSAIYPGTFDPMTNGHIDVVERGMKIFDRIVIAVGNNPEKKPLFTIKERIDMIKECTRHLKNIEVVELKGLLRDFARKEKCGIILRGLRAISDFEFEFQRALMNREIDNEIETVFIMTKVNYVYLNSSIVKEIALLNGNVSKFVPSAVRKKLSEKVKQSP